MAEDTAPVAHNADTPEATAPVKAPRKAATKKPAKPKAAKEKAAKEKKPAKTKVAADGDEADKPAKTPRKTKEPKVEAVVVTTIMHGETRLNHILPEDAAPLTASIGMIDAVHALGRVRITSAAHAEGVTTLHVVLPDHPGDHETRPGVILSIDADEGTLRFDHVELGDANDAVVDDAAFSLLTSIAGDDLNPALANGRRADWFARCLDAADAVASRHA